MLISMSSKYISIIQHIYNTAYMVCNNVYNIHLYCMVYYHRLPSSPFSIQKHANTNFVIKARTKCWLGWVSECMQCKHNIFWFALCKHAMKGAMGFIFLFALSIFGFFVCALVICATAYNRRSNDLVEISCNFNRRNHMEVSSKSWNLPMHSDYMIIRRKC